MPQVQKDCCYYVEEREGVPPGQWRIRAMCMKCAKDVNGKMPLMFWPGSALGYGHDVECTWQGCGEKICVSDASAPNNQ